MIIFRTVVTVVLRERGRHGRAGFAVRGSRERVDPSEHGGLLAVLHLEPATSPRTSPL
jgi:hypothetical protein